MPKKRLASEGVAVIELEIVSFAKPHHWRRSGAIVDFAGFELFEEKFFESCDFGVEVFTWSQEKPDDEGFEQSDTDVSVGLTGRFSADIDPVVEKQVGLFTCNNKCNVYVQNSFRKGYSEYRQ